MKQDYGWNAIEKRQLDNWHY